MTRILAALEPLEHEDLERVAVWLERRLLELEEPPTPAVQGSDRRVRGRVTYQRELVRCGKPSCRCATMGDAHGPYWYGYRWESGRIRKHYIGRDFAELSERFNVEAETPSRRATSGKERPSR